MLCASQLPWGPFVGWNLMKGDLPYFCEDIGEAGIHVSRYLGQNYALLAEDAVAGITRFGKLYFGPEFSDERLPASQRLASPVIFLPVCLLRLKHTLSSQLRAHAPTPMSKGLGVARGIIVKGSAGRAAARAGEHGEAP